MENKKLAEQLKAVADPARLRILELLPPTKDCKEVYNVTELAEELELPQPTVSHHLKVLYNAEIVQSEKMCRDVYYWIDREKLNSILSQFKGIVKLK